MTLPYTPTTLTAIAAVGAGLCYSKECPFFLLAPPRSYEPLAIRICKAAYTIMDGNRAQWASVAKVSQVIKVKDEEMLSSAITLAAQKGWLVVGGQPVHSVLLTDKGEAVALSS